MPPEVIQLLIYGGVALGGYLLRHVNLFKHPAPTVPAPTPTPAPDPAPAPLSHPILDRILPVIQQELDTLLADATRRFLTPTPPPATKP
jgi:hypothetical protein